MQLSMSSFELKLSKAIEQVRVLLHTARNPCAASDVPHRYEDKYLLAECLTNAAVASQLNCLTELGLGSEALATLRGWCETSAVQLRFRAEEYCTFSREATRQVESPNKRVARSVGGAVVAALTSSTVTTVTDYYFEYRVSYALSAVRGVGVEASDSILLLSRESSDEIMRNSRSLPFPAASVPAALIEYNVSWLLRHLQDASGVAVPSFTIDRTNSKCHTPRRNLETQESITHFAGFADWSSKVTTYLGKLLRGASNFKNADGTTRSPPDTSRYTHIFIPVIPLFEDKEGSSAVEGGASSAAAVSGDTVESSLAVRLPADLREDGPLMGVVDTNCFLGEEVRHLREVRAEVGRALPENTSASASEARLAITLSHCEHVCGQWAEAMDYIEGLLRQQVIAAIGKEVTPADFKEYMEFHNRRLFAPAFLPRPFSFAVRRSGVHSPEGTLSIEGEPQGGGGDAQIAAPIVTVAARTAAPSPMEFAIGASTKITFRGDRYLHAYLAHQFSGGSGTRLSLVARARQFSSFLVVVGRISSATAVEPKFAAIVQNKDELNIPLEMSTIPSAREFRDAIESLSPQQQAFCKAFRAMQLESTLFGVLVIQIKPQLEKVLNLPEDSLTKEIKLTQDLMNLFIKYQIPTDLLSFDPVDEASGLEVVGVSHAEKLQQVKAHVSSIHQMIDESKAAEIEERRQEEEFKHPAAADLLRDTSSDESELSCEFFEDADSRMRVDFEEALTKQRTVAKKKKEVLRAAPPVQRRGLAFKALPLPSPAAVQTSSAAPLAAPIDSCEGGGEGRDTAEGSAQRRAPPPPESGVEGAEGAEGRDLTAVPSEMDRRFEALDTDGAVRPTIIKPSGVWTRRAQKALLSSPTTATLTGDDQRGERDAAFDLLDALTKSGGLPVDHASLHVVIAATHCFDKSILETVVQDNVNPIEKVERSTLIMASTVHQRPTEALLDASHVARVTAASPQLFLEES